MAKSILLSRDADPSIEGIDGAEMDIFDEYTSILRNEIKEGVDDYWIQTKKIIPDTNLKKILLITKKNEIIRLAKNVRRALDKGCFWVAFLFPTIDEAMHLDADREPQRNFNENINRMIDGQSNRSLTFKEIRRVLVGLDDLQADIGLKYFHHVRRIWEKTKLREVFDKAFELTGFKAVVQKYTTDDPKEANSDDGEDAVKEKMAILNSKWDAFQDYINKKKMEL